MKILMLTNTYKPHLSGVARSIETYSERLKKHGHKVIVIAPEYPGAIEEKDVYRIPSITNKNGYSIPVMFGFAKTVLNNCIKLFAPDIVHSHHPVLLGDVALEVRKFCNVPIVFTYHTVYEEHIHHAGLPKDFNEISQIAAISKALSYCSKVNHVVSPSNGIKSTLRNRGVTCPISVIPTGIDETVFNNSNRKITRSKLAINDGDFVLGHVGRLTKEKNLTFLFESVRRYLEYDKSSKFVLVGGQSPDIEDLLSMFDNLRGTQFIYVGIKHDKELVDIYSAMDCFVFASKSETQGMVLAEAILCGVPVVAISATGVNDIVKNGINGLLAKENFQSFVSSISRCKNIDRRGINNSVFDFTIEICIQKLLEIYRDLSYEQKLMSGMAMLARRR